MEAIEYKLSAKIRCICGRQSTVIEGAPVMCACGVELSLKPGKGDTYVPWATAPDEYDLGKRKYNRPAVIKSEWIVKAGQPAL